ncbi:MAG: hypothetical protein KIS76_16415 [Pyrinomonadaceae bacterium]|nr:hypothetical protein [Pyrinomonadaceae bacterium]
MKVDMSPKAIEDRLKLVGQLTKACLMIRRGSLENKSNSKRFEKKFSNNTVERKL